MKITSCTVMACFLLILVLGMIVPAAAHTTVAVDSVSNSNCEKVSIEIDSDEVFGIGSATINLVYNTSILTLKTTNASGDLGEVTLSGNSGTIYMVAATSDSPGPNGTVKFAELEFCPVSGASGCSDLDLTVQEITNGNIGNDIKVIQPDTVTDGQFCIAQDNPEGTCVSVSPASITSDGCEIVSIIIDTDDDAGIGSATIKLTYDISKINLTGVSGGAIGMDSWNDNNGEVTMTAADLTARPSGNDILFADLTFCPIAGASGCSDLDIEVVSIYNYNDGKITSTVNDGQFCITENGNDNSVSSSSSSNGGSSGTSGEAFNNIQVSETERKNVYKDKKVSYSFNEEGNIVRYINFTGLINAGEISTKVEMLKNTSTLVDHPPFDLVYKNLNICVGGYNWANLDNIETPKVNFVVEKAWVLENNVDESTIQLLHYTEGEWNPLATSLVGQDAGYLNFEAETTGFSPFAVVGKVSDSGSGEEGIGDSGDSEDDDSSSQDPLSTDETNGSPGFGLFAGLMVLMVVVQLLRKK